VFVHSRVPIRSVAISDIVSIGSILLHPSPFAVVDPTADILRCLAGLPDQENGAIGTVGTRRSEYCD